MSEEYELIFVSYNSLESDDIIFDNTTFIIELMAKKKFCAYQRLSGDCKLRKKQQRELDSLVNERLELLGKALDEKKARPLILLDETLEQLEKALKERYTPESGIEFLGLNIEGVINIATDEEAMSRHHDDFMEAFKKEFDEDYMDPSPEEWLEFFKEEGYF